MSHAVKRRPVDWSTLSPEFVAKYLAAMAKRAENPPKVYTYEERLAAVEQRKVELTEQLARVREAAK